MPDQTAGIADLQPSRRFRASESALWSHPCVAVISAQVLTVKFKCIPRTPKLLLLSPTTTRYKELARLFLWPVLKCPPEVVRKQVNRALKMIVVIGAALLVTAAIWSYGRARIKATRESGDQAALRLYTRDLKPGLNRKEVEGYFRTRDIRFWQMCCVDGPQNAWADFVKIGEESPPWYCSTNWVNIAFEFKATEPHRCWESRDNDVLESVRIFRPLGGCL